MKVFLICALFCVGTVVHSLSTMNQNESNLLQLLTFIQNIEISFLMDSLLFLPDSITAPEVQSIIDQKRYDLDVVSGLLESELSSTGCKYDFTPINNPNMFFSAARAFSAVGVALRVGYLRTHAPPTWDTLWAIGGGIESEARHEAVFLERAGKHASSRFNVTLPSTWAYNLVRPFVVEGSCVFPDAPNLPGLRLVQLSGSRALFEWSEKITPNNRFSIVWVDGSNIPVYTPLILTSNFSGVTHIPDGFSGLLLAALSLGASMGNDRLSHDTLTGPAIADIERPMADLLAPPNQYNWDLKA